MKHLLILVMSLLLCSACGTDGKDGAAGPTGPVGEAGGKGETGASAPAAAFKDVLFCQATLEDRPLLGPFWTGTTVTYQRVRFVSGDEMVSAFVAGKAGLNESATSFYKARTDKPLVISEITVGAGDADFVYVYMFDGASEPVIETRGTSTMAKVTKTCSLSQ